MTSQKVHRFHQFQCGRVKWVWGLRGELGRLSPRAIIPFFQVWHRGAPRGGAGGGWQLWAQHAHQGGPQAFPQRVCQAGAVQVCVVASAFGIVTNSSWLACTQHVWQLLERAVLFLPRRFKGFVFSRFSLPVRLTLRNSAYVHFSLS